MPLVYLIKGQKIQLTFQLRNVKHPIMGVGNFCGRAEGRSAMRHGSIGSLHHEHIGSVEVLKKLNHYALTCWSWKPSCPQPWLVAPALVGSQHQIMQDVLPGLQEISTHGVEEHAPRSTRGSEEPSPEEIDWHNFTYDPAKPWCELCDGQVSIRRAVVSGPTGRSDPDRPLRPCAGRRRNVTARQISNSPSAATCRRASCGPQLC